MPNNGDGDASILNPPVPRPDLPIAIQTLTAGGFMLDRVERRPGYALIFAHRRDEFGAPNNYCFALAAGEMFESEQIEAIRIPAEQFNSRLILIGSTADAVPSVEWSRFLGVFGGPVFGTSAFEPDFVDQLVVLGRNELPSGLSGKPDDLFEAFVRAGLEFVLAVRVVRYGQERRFEARPDGLVLPYRGFCAIYDGKAYSDGYDVSIDTTRQFGAYVREFQQRYDAYLGRLNAVIVVSAKFRQQEDSLRARSGDLLSECGVPFSFMTAGVFAEIIRMIVDCPLARRSVDWRRVFSDPIVRPSAVKSQLDAIRKDGIVRWPRT